MRRSFASALQASNPFIYCKTLLVNILHAAHITNFSKGIAFGIKEQKILCIQMNG